MCIRDRSSSSDQIYFINGQCQYYLLELSLYPDNSILLINETFSPVSIMTSVSIPFTLSLIHIQMCIRDRSYTTLILLNLQLVSTFSLHSRKCIRETYLWISVNCKIHINTYDFFLHNTFTTYTENYQHLQRLLRFHQPALTHEHESAATDLKL